MTEGRNVAVKAALTGEVLLKLEHGAAIAAEPEFGASLGFVTAGPKVLIAVAVVGSAVPSMRPEGKASVRGTLTTLTVDPLVEVTLATRPSPLAPPGGR